MIVRRPFQRSAFTLVELLVVILIIGVLIGILIPVIGRARTSAYVADSRNWLNNLQAAIDRYQGDFRAYPGPISNMQIWNTSAGGAPPITAVAAPGFDITGFDKTKITMSENLTLGLLGGLSNIGGVISYTPSQVGLGPTALNPVNPKRYPPYLEPLNLSWQRNPFIATADSKTGKYFDDAAPLTSATAGGADDSIIPEFVDRFPDAMPVLYMRSRLGVPVISTALSATNNSVITNDPTAAATPTPRAGPYDLSQIIGYTSKGIGVGRSLKAGEYVGVTYPAHGLTTVDTTKTTLAKTSQYPYDAFPYFQSPNSQNIARQKDGYILISAGRDRTYGTDDDICNFGDVSP